MKITSWTFLNSKAFMSVLVFFFSVSQSSEMNHKPQAVVHVSPPHPPTHPPPPFPDSGLHGLYLRQHSSAITCLSEFCQLCLCLSLPATTVRGLSERQVLNIDQTYHYQDHLREKPLLCSKLLFPIT